MEAIPKENFTVDLIGVGDQKAATSWITQCLSEHPDVCISSKKETRFFERHDCHENFQDYQDFFSQCSTNQIKAEFSPTYMHTPYAARNIANVLPNAKLLFCLRNPVDKLYSEYWFNRRRGGNALKYRTFEEAASDPNFTKRNHYAKKVQRFIDVFPREQIQIQIYEDMQEDPVSFMQEIYRFAGVDAAFEPPSATKRINASPKEQLPQWAERLLGGWYTLGKYAKRLPGLRTVHSGPVLRATMSAAKSVQKAGIKTTAESPQELPATLKMQLYELYKDDIEYVEHLIGREIPQWHEQ